jgi:hypothetical protein
VAAALEYSFFSALADGAHFVRFCCKKDETLDEAEHEILSTFTSYTAAGTR